MARTKSACIIAFSALVVGALALSGCSAKSYAWGVAADDVIGVWVNPGEIGTELEIFADGTFQASSWPSSLNCAGPIAADAEALGASPTRDLTGEWSLFGGEGDNAGRGAMASLTLYMEEDCDPDVRAPMAYFTESESGVLNLCFPLDQDPDSFTSTRGLGFVGAPVGPTPTDEVCRVHG